MLPILPVPEGGTMAEKEFYNRNMTRPELKKFQIRVYNLILYELRSESRTKSNIDSIIIGGLINQFLVC